MTVVPQLQIKLQPSRYTKIQLSHYPAKLPYNTVLLYRLQVYINNTQFYRTNFQAFTTFVVPTARQGKYTVIATSRLFLRKDHKVDLSRVLRCAAAANYLILHNKVVEHGVFQQLTNALGDHELAECAQYTAGLANAYCGLEVLRQQVDESDCVQVFASGAEFFSYRAQQVFLISATLPDNTITSLQINGLYYYNFEQTEQRKRIRMIAQPASSKQFYIYSREYMFGAMPAVFTGLCCGARVSHYIFGEQLTNPTVMRELAPYCIKDDRIKFVCNVIDDKAVTGKSKHTMFILFNKSKHIAVGISGEGKINFELPFYEEQLKLIAYDKYALKGDLFKTSEYHRALVQHCTLTISVANNFFFTSIGVTDSGKETIDTAFFSYKEDYTNVDLQKYIKKGLLRDDHSFGIINALGQVFVMYTLTSIVIQAERICFYDTIVRIVDGLCMYQDSDTSFLILCETQQQENQRGYVLMAILYTGELVKIFPLSLTNLYRNQSLLTKNPNEPVVGIRKVENSLILLVFHFFVVCFDTQSGKVEWQFTNDNSIINSSFKKMVSRKLLTPVSEAHYKYDSAYTVGSYDVHSSASGTSEMDKASLTSDFLPTSQTENSDELVVAVESVETDAISLAYAPYYIPLRVDRPSYQTIKLNYQIGQLLDAQIFEFREQRFIYLLQLKQTGVYGVWWSYNLVRKTCLMVGCVGICKNGDHGYIIKQIDSVIFAVSGSGKTVVKEIGLFGELRREFVFNGDFSIVESGQGFEGKMRQGEWN